MNCPKCKTSWTKVTDSRPSPSSVYRRRKCCKCKHTWSTFELLQADVRATGAELGKLFEQLRADLQRVVQKAQRKLRL